jgi:GNAT superfamily N-acetyltransferase
MSAKFTIRASVPADAEAVFRMIVDSADSDGAREAVCVDAAALLRDRFGDAPRFQLLVAEGSKGAVVGMAMYSFSYSTWISVDGLFLDDLYVVPAGRRQGITRALLMHVARIACQERCRRFQWLENEHTLRVKLPAAADEVLLENLCQNPTIGLLVLDPRTRRRMRINGIAEMNCDGHLRVRVSQVYSNCPQYIQARVFDSEPTKQSLQRTTTAAVLSSAQEEVIRKADTFFLATHHPQSGADASHRGGLPDSSKWWTSRHSSGLTIAGITCFRASATSRFSHAPGSCLWISSGATRFNSPAAPRSFGIPSRCPASRGRSG